MVINPKFTTSSPIVPTFDFVDIANGTGYVEFSAFTTKDSAATEYHIINKVLKSDEVQSNSIAEVDWQTTFTIKRVLQGKMFIQVHWGYRTSSASTHSLTISVQKNGTEIATVTTEDNSFNGDESIVSILEVNIPLTSFSNTDVLSIATDMTTDGTVITSFIAHDPFDQDFTPDSPWTGGAISDTKFTVQVPFKVIQ